MLHLQTAVCKIDIHSSSTCVCSVQSSYVVSCVPHRYSLWQVLTSRAQVHLYSKNLTFTQKDHGNQPQTAWRPILGGNPYIKKRYLTESIKLLI